MQEVTVASVEKKTPQKEGASPFYVVKGQGGEELTTFDPAALGWGAGSKVNVDVKVKGKFTNIDKWEPIAIIPPGSGPSGNGDGPKPQPSGHKRDTAGIEFEYRLKARLQQIERASIEGQTAYIKIMDAFAAGKLDVTGAFVTEALEWARVKIKATLVDQPVSEPTRSKSSAKKTDAPVETGTGEPVDPSVPFSNVGALLNWCKDHGIDRSTFMEITSTSEKDIAKVDIAEAFQLVKVYVGGNEEKSTEELEKELGFK